MSRIRTCIIETCGTKFETDRLKQVTCSPACYQKYWRIKHGARSEPLPETCALPGCNKVVHRAGRGRPKLYCSDAHMKRHHYEKQFGTSDLEKIGTCLHIYCETGKFVMARPNQKYCCDECRVKHNNMKRTSANQIVLERKLKHTCLCNYCGIEFKSAQAKTKFCNKSCRNMFSKQMRLPEWVNIGISHGREDTFPRGEDLSGEIFIDCKFNYFDFNRVNLTKARFIRCEIEASIFDGCIMYGTEFIDCTYPDESFFDGALLGDNKSLPTNSNFSGALKSKLKLADIRTNETESLKFRALHYYGR